MNGTDPSSAEPWRLPAFLPGAVGSIGDNIKRESTGGALSSPPAISLPKGGSAIRVMGETFAVNPVTGTCSLSFPPYTSPGRSGLGLQLSLSYDLKAGNSPLGFGRSQPISSKTRKTEESLPKYPNADESDVFILSGPGQLVPVLRPDGTKYEDVTTVPGYCINRYRSRIERWTCLTDDDVHWRSMPKNNILVFYGKDENFRIADPADPRHLFDQLICESHDVNGRVVHYRYRPEHGVGVVLTRTRECLGCARDNPTQLLQR